MYAVIKTGGKQYRVAPEDVLTIEKVKGDADTGNMHHCWRVLFVDALYLGFQGIDGLYQRYSSSLGRDGRRCGWCCRR